MVVLACLFTYVSLLIVLQHGIVPSDFSVGFIIPLLKNKHGDHSSLQAFCYSCLAFT